MSPLQHDTERVIRLINDLKTDTTRLLIAIAGPPGSGKSTLAEEVVGQLNEKYRREDFAALLPMDGFHLDNSLLIEKRLLDRKGAPQTFDAPGLLLLLKEVRNSQRDIAYPIFDRAADCSITDGGVLKKSTEVVVIEGNYLLLDEPVWHDMPTLFDASVFLSPPLEELRQRLIRRWLNYGFAEADAVRRAEENDLLNAELILQRSQKATLHLHSKTD